MKNKNAFENYKLNTLINLTVGIVYTLLLIPTHFDISALAFPLAFVYTGLTIWFTYFKMIKNTDGTHYYKVIKFTEYFPYFLFICFILRRAGEFGTPFWYDVITVILWFIILVFSFLTSRVLYPKNNKEIVKNWNVVPKAKKFIGLGKLAFEIVDWIDALVWAVFTIMIFQVFFLQLYEIPSESMVPTFLIKDRVFVSKIDCGPKFPLTDVGLPDIRNYKRGDTIVLRNPHYSMDRKSEVKSVAAQLINMLTLTTVNLNKDENGELKADPLVKRIAGEPGEQLVMQDGVLYRRTIESDVFEPVDKDKKFATWNLNSLSPKIKSKVQYFPFDGSGYERMINFEEERRNYDLNVAEFLANELSRKFRNLAFTDNLIGKFEEPSLFEFDLFRNYQVLARNLMCQEGGSDWFEKFITSWIPSKDKYRDMYAESNYKLNVMTKITFAKLIVKMAELYSSDISATEWMSDGELVSLIEDAETLHWYIQILLDSRNMPVFPACDSSGNPNYIPNNCYFMMGDNRFNSLDLRHSSEQVKAVLTNQDPLSVSYYSMMAPQYIHKKYIVGKPIFRFWPLNRVGRV